MKRTIAIFCLLVSASGGCGAASEREDERALSRFVTAWPMSAGTLRRTITGAGADDLVRALGGLREHDVRRASLADIEHRGDAIGARVRLSFADGGAIDLRIRAQVEDDRVVAEPHAISMRLAHFAPLRIETFGSPRPASARTRDGTRLHAAPTSLRSAIDLIDSELAVRLRGHPGRTIVAGSHVIARSPVADGEAVRTSLDDTMQAAAENALGDSVGALVAVDPRTGGIRALVSNGDHPATSASSPGSTFKIVTAAAALERHVYASRDRVACPAATTIGDRRVTNFRFLSYGSISFERAFAVSCNTAFARIGVAVGTSGLLDTARRLGFAIATSGGPAVISRPASRGDLAAWSFGAEGSRISPLRMAGIASVIARRGTALGPAFTDARGPGLRVLRTNTADVLVTMMEEVVASGTGRNAALPGVTIAGKTGTADPQTKSGRSDAWFVGLLPSHRTRLVAVGFLPGAGIGGERAALLVRTFFAAVL